MEQFSDSAQVFVSGHGDEKVGNSAGAIGMVCEVFGVDVPPQLGGEFFDRKLGHCTWME